MTSHLHLNILLYKGNVITKENFFSAAPTQCIDDLHSVMRRSAFYVKLSRGSIMDLQGHFTPEHTTELVGKKAGQGFIQQGFISSSLLLLSLSLYHRFLWKWSWGYLDPGIKNIPSLSPNRKAFLTILSLLILTLRRKIGEKYSFFTYIV